MKIYVKYCGGCNPRYDRKKFVDEVQAGVGAEIVCAACKTEDICLLISGCERNCLKRMEDEGTIGVNHLDRSGKVVEKILAMKGKK